MVRTAVLVSGGGTNLQAILDARLFGELENCDLCAVISSSPEAYALTRAKNAGVPTYIVDHSLFPTRRAFTTAILDKLKDLDIELVVLAGFMHILGDHLVHAYEGRMLNVHPSLIPSFCGDGFYGLRVHQAALAYGVKVTGATVHFVTSEPDAGPVVLQRAVDVHEDDTPQTLQKRVMEEAEWKLLPQAISLYCEGRLQLDGRRVIIKPEEKEEASENA